MIFLTSILGCSNLYTQKTDPEIELSENIEKLRNQIPNEFLVKCPEKPPFKGKTLGDWADHTLLFSEQYEECMIRHNSWVEWEKSNKTD